MNRDETIAAIAVMQSWVDGDEIESKDKRAGQGFHSWWKQETPCEDMRWDFETHEFRSKPKPREWWLAPESITGDGYGNFRTSYPGGGIWVKVREIIE